MPALNAIPCKNPTVSTNVLVDVYSSATRYQLVCHVPGCDWTVNHVIKSAATEAARWHRDHHRINVPDTRIKHDTEWNIWDVYCPPCGARTFNTRREAEAWLDKHLRTEHGLVVCP